MQKVLLSAYACDPSKGSEPGNGFNWANQLALLGYEVYCVTTSKGKRAIENEMGTRSNPRFIYVDLPWGLDSIYYKSQLGMYLHYILWQWKAYCSVKKMHRSYMFDLVHHITWGSIQQGSFMYKLNIPLVFGPAGGGQRSLPAFKDYFLGHWENELKREYVSNKLQKFNPACYGMLKKAKVIMASNPDTKELAERLGAKNVHLVFDMGLEDSFFPDSMPFKEEANGKLKLLWVGRFLPRKGLMLLLEIMDKLKSYKEIELTVVGDGEMKEPFLKGIDEKQLKNINWVGKVPFEKVKDYYATHHLFLFTSLRDSGGVQLIEAMAYGLPVVALDMNAASLVLDKDRGVKIKPTSPKQVVEDFVEAIIHLNNDRKDLRAMSAAAYEYAKGFTWSKKIKEISERYYS